MDLSTGLTTWPRSYTINKGVLTPFFYACFLQIVMNTWYNLFSY
jgi:hypothetical protein